MVANDELIVSVGAAASRRLLRARPTLTAVARDLGMSARSLQRCLEARGTSFREIADGALRDRAEALLRATDHPLTEVGFLLGFSEQSAFTRSFKRWTGMSPGAWRRTSATEAALGRSARREGPRPACARVVARGPRDVDA